MVAGLGKDLGQDKKLKERGNVSVRRDERAEGVQPDFAKGIRRC